MFLTVNTVATRLIFGVRSHFYQRLAEWFLALLMLNFGVTLLVPGDTFSSSVAIAALSRLASEPAWGWICTVLGLLRVLALTLNGTFATSTYGRYSPHIRGALALLSCLIWLQVALSVLVVWIEIVRPAMISLGTYALYLVADWFTMKRAWSDAREADLAAKR